MELMSFIYVIISFYVLAYSKIHLTVCANCLAPALPRRQPPSSSLPSPPVNFPFLRHHFNESLSNLEQARIEAGMREAGKKGKGICGIFPWSLSPSICPPLCLFVLGCEAAAVVAVFLIPGLGTRARTLHSLAPLSLCALSLKFR